MHILVSCPQHDSLGNDLQLAVKGSICLCVPENNNPDWWFLSLTRVESILETFCPGYMREYHRISAKPTGRRVYKFFPRQIELKANLR